MAYFYDGFVHSVVAIKLDQSLQWLGWRWMYSVFESFIENQRNFAKYHIEKSHTMNSLVLHAVIASVISICSQICLILIEYVWSKADYYGKQYLLIWNFFFSLFCSYSMATCDWIGHLSACKTWILLWWPFDCYALQWRNHINWSPSIYHIIYLSHFVDMWGLLLCTGVAKIGTLHGVITAGVEMV